VHIVHRRQQLRQLQQFDLCVHNVRQWVPARRFRHDRHMLAVHSNQRVCDVHDERVHVLHVHEYNTVWRVQLDHVPVHVVLWSQQLRELQCRELCVHDVQQRVPARRVWRERHLPAVHGHLRVRDVRDERLHVRYLHDDLYGTRDLRRVQLVDVPVHVLLWRQQLYRLQQRNVRVHDVRRQVRINWLWHNRDLLFVQHDHWVHGLHDKRVHLRYVHGNLWLHWHEPRRLPV